MSKNQINKYVWLVETLMAHCDCERLETKESHRIGFK